jgi:CheY-like chemotaxis protein
MEKKPTKKHTVIWADDDLDDLLIMRETMERIDHDHRVVEAHNGREVLEHLQTLKHTSLYPCLIILDINMPLLNGRDTLVLIRKEEKYNDIPVVMFTTSSNELDRTFCNRFGAKLYTKPHSLAEYEQAIATLLTHCNDYQAIERVA